MATPTSGDEDSPGRRAGVVWAQHTLEPIRRTFEVTAHGGTIEVLQPDRDFRRAPDDLEAADNEAAPTESGSRCDDRLAQTICEAMLSPECRRALTSLRDGSFGLSMRRPVPHALKAALRSTADLIQDDEALLSLVLRVMGHRCQEAITTVTKQGARERLSAPQTTSGNVESARPSSRIAQDPIRPEPRRLVLAEDRFENLYLDMVQHLSAFPRADAAADDDHETLVKVVRELLLDAEIAFSIKTRFAALSADKLEETVRLTS